MIWLLAGLAAVGLFYLVRGEARRLSPDKFRAFAVKLGIGIAVGLGLFFLLTGRLAGAVPLFAVAAAGVARYRQLTQFIDTMANRTGGAVAAQAMGLAEAYEVLGLKPGATAEDVRAAHRKLIQALHPDQGGTDYLAAKINRARDMLLKALGA
jgi:hypothetical protein